MLVFFSRWMTLGFDWWSLWLNFTRVEHFIQKVLKGPLILIIWIPWFGAIGQMIFCPKWFFTDEIFFAELCHAIMPSGHSRLSISYLKSKNWYHGISDLVSEACEWFARQWIFQFFFYYDTGIFGGQITNSRFKLTCQRTSGFENFSIFSMIKLRISELCV